MLANRARTLRAAQAKAEQLARDRTQAVAEKERIADQPKPVLGGVKSRTATSSAANSFWSFLNTNRSERSRASSSNQPASGVTEEESEGFFSDTTMGINNGLLTLIVVGGAAYLVLRR